MDRTGKTGLKETKMNGKIEVTVRQRVARESFPMVLEIVTNMASSVR